VIVSEVLPKVNVKGEIAGLPGIAQLKTEPRSAEKLVTAYGRVIVRPPTPALLFK
jgi:hypothetical protein